MSLKGGKQSMEASAPPTPQPRDVEVPMLNGVGRHEVSSPRSQRLDKPKSRVSISVITGTIYCLASMGMTLCNKAVLSGFAFNCSNVILLLQCLTCITCVKTGQWTGLLTVEPFSRPLVRMWLPVNLIFVGMIATSFWALESMNVAMVTLLKVAVTNIFVLGGDYYFYGRTYNLGVWASLALMIISALCGAVTDLTFNARGYVWQVANCAFTAAYSLYLRGTMDRVKKVTSNGQPLNEASMVFYNNILSLPLLVLLVTDTGELRAAFQQPDLYKPAFQVSVLFSGLLAFGLCFVSIWFLGSTTPTIFSLVGSLNKAPTALLGLLAFHTPVTGQNLASIVLGLAAGVVFVVAKSKS